MKKDIFTIICMSLICASVMLGIMGLYRLVGIQNRQSRITPDSGVHLTAFKADGFLSIS